MAFSCTTAICIFASSLPFVSSKGCFLGTVEITLADGKRKQLQHVRAGDILASFDDATGKRAVSSVMGIPKFFRVRSDLVEIILPNARIHATHDHPFWSRERTSLVSANPNRTMDEYALEAHAMRDDEELEDEQQGGVGISGIHRASARKLAIPSLMGNANEVEVMTLCMHPHHWYYVNGVRVHNKGCFMPSTPVSLADGSQRELRHISVGDNVSSWDDVLQRSVNSTVVAVPSFRRRVSELVEISLPSAHIHVTHDHPFWSKGRDKLVSMHPNQTREDYDLEAELMVVGEELQEEQHMHVVGLRRLAANRGTPEGDKSVDVMTLCLQPYHWYYVHGVRVHNKGCFASWTPVLMSDHTHKSISEVRERDSVISWDESTGQTSVATVLEIVQFPADDLLEVSLNITQAQRARQLASTSADPWLENMPKLIMTKDHPIYSARARSVVSMDPSQSSELYGLKVEQMHEHELLHHYLGHEVHAQVLPWNKSLGYVMTLRLDRHHWFHVYGLRVHNKGGGGGGGVGGGGGFTSMRTVRSTRGTYSGSWIALVMLSGGSRRRWGDYREEPDSKCDMVSESEAENLCCDTGLGECAREDTYAPGSIYQQNCHDCLQCDAEDCVKNKPNCETFLDKVFTSCEHEEEETNVKVILILVAVFTGISLVFCGCYLFKQQMVSRKNPAVDDRQRARDAMLMCNGVHVGPQLQFNGTYTENGETKPTTYNFNIDHEGQLSGQGRDDDGVCQCVGKLNWAQGAAFGEIAWRETWAKWVCENAGTVQYNGPELCVRANYDSTFQQTKGNVVLTCPNSGSAPLFTGVVVQASVVGNDGQKLL